MSNYFKMLTGTLVGHVLVGGTDDWTPNGTEGTDWETTDDPSTTIDALIAAKVAAINVKKTEILDTGAPYTVDGTTYYIQLDDGSRANLSALGTAALSVIADGGTWQDTYSTGWITKSNVRIALSTAAEGFALASSVAVYYSSVVQNARDLKDSAEACTTSDGLDAIDITDGWPSETDTSS